MSKKKTNEQFLSEIGTINPNVEILGSYVNSHTKIKTLCKICGNVWEITPKDLLHGYGCKICSIKRRTENRKIKKEDFVERVLSSNPNLELLEEYKSLNDKITVKCRVCENIWKPRAFNILYGRGCPKCAIDNNAKKHRKSQEEFEKEVQKIIPTIEVMGKYINSDTAIKCKCLICSFVWDALPQSLLNGHGCRRCSRSGTSFMEQFIYWAFDLVLGKGKVISRDKNAIGMELDIYIPEYNLAIEPGTWAFHKNSLNRDMQKRVKCKEKGIRLITIYDSFPSNNVKPFLDDCIVFEDDYNTSNHINIRALVEKLFSMNNIFVNFTEEQWTNIENKAYFNARAKNTEDFIEELEGINDSIEILGVYKGSKIPINVKCKICNFIWAPRPANLLNGTNCPMCSKKNNTKKQTKSHEQYVGELRKIQPKITILGQYKKGKDHIAVKCNVCGTEWSPIAAALLNGEGCPKCGLIKKANSRRKTQNQYEKELFAINPNIKVIGTYLGTTKPIRVKCSICGYEWERVARKLLENPHHRNERKIHEKC